MLLFIVHLSIVYCRSEEGEEAATKAGDETGEEVEEEAVPPFLSSSMALELRV